MFAQLIGRVFVLRYGNERCKRYQRGNGWQISTLPEQIDKGCDEDSNLTALVDLFI